MCIANKIALSTHKNYGLGKSNIIRMWKGPFKFPPPLRKALTLRRGPSPGPKSISFSLIGVLYLSWATSSYPIWNPIIYKSRLRPSLRADTDCSLVSIGISRSFSIMYCASNGQTMLRHFLRTVPTAGSGL